MDEDVCRGSQWTMIDGHTNPVHQHVDGSWWFTDEVWADEYGPYPDEPTANTKLKQYVQSL